MGSADLVVVMPMGQIEHIGQSRKARGDCRGRVHHPEGWVILQGKGLGRLTTKGMGRLPNLRKIGWQQGVGKVLVGHGPQPAPDRHGADRGRAEICACGVGPAMDLRIDDLDAGWKAVDQNTPSLAFE